MEWQKMKKILRAFIAITIMVSICSSAIALEVSESFIRIGQLSVAVFSVEGGADFTLQNQEYALIIPCLLMYRKHDKAILSVGQLNGGLFCCLFHCIQDHILDHVVHRFTLLGKVFLNLDHRFAATVV